MEARVALVHASRYVRLALRRQRWHEYASYLRAARSAGMQLVSVESWMAGVSDHARSLVLRHDVDQNPTSAMHMARLEALMGVHSTYYFRWSTLHLPTIRAVQHSGHDVGLHYETLTRYAIEQDLRSPAALTPSVLQRCRERLRVEIARFKKLVGECESVAAHGDRRARQIGMTNAVLLDGEPYAAYGIRWSADDRDMIAGMGCYVSDGNTVPVAWSRGISILEAIEAGHPVVLFNSHPHHWRAGGPVVARRVAENLGDLLRQPNGFTWGRPEALAWRRYNPVDRGKRL